jgi:hypothetical protein
MKTRTLGRRKVVDLKKRARRVLKASSNLVEQRWGKLDRRKHSARSIHITKFDPELISAALILSSDALPYSPLWYRGSNAIVDAVAHAKSYSQRHPVVIRVYDGNGNVTEMLEDKGDFKKW